MGGDAGVPLVHLAGEGAWARLASLCWLGVILWSLVLSPTPHGVPRAPAWVEWEHGCESLVQGPRWQRPAWFWPISHWHNRPCAFFPGKPQQRLAEQIINFSNKLNGFAFVSRKSPTGRGIFKKTPGLSFTSELGPPTASELIECRAQINMAAASHTRSTCRGGSPWRVPGRRRVSSRQCLGACVVGDTLRCQPLSTTCV